MLTQLAVILATLTLLMVFGYHIIIYIGSRKHISKLLNVSRTMKCSKTLTEISIVVPTKGEPLDLLSQTTRDKALALKHSCCLRGEVLIISDDSEEYVQDLKNSLDDLIKEGIVNVLRRPEPEGGRTGALDFGAKTAKYPYVLILDSDSRVSEQTLNALCSKLSNEEKPVVVIPWKGYSHQKTRLSEAVEFNTDTTSFLLYKLRWVAGFFIFPLGSGTVIRKDVLEEVDYWGPNIIQDDIWLGTKLATRNYFPDLLPEGETEVLVPSRLRSFRIQQSRWAYGTSEIFSRTYRKILRSPLSLRVKLEMLMYILQPAVSIPYTLATIIALVAAFLEPGWGVFHTLHSLSILFSAGIAEGLILVYAALHINIGKLVKEATRKATLVQIGRAAATYGVLFPIIGVYSLLGLLKVKLTYKITPKGGAEEVLNRDWAPLIISLGSGIGIIASLLTINLVALLILLTPFISGVYALIRLK